MRSVRGKDTKPGRVVRKLLWTIRPGYRLQRRDLPGRPDISYGRSKQAVFVHGCFWHGHDCRRGARLPKTNRGYWTTKIARNRERDGQALSALAERGWGALVVWECELADEVVLTERLRAFLGR